MRLMNVQDLHKPKQSVLRVSLDVNPDMRIRTKRLFLLEYEGTLCAPVSLTDLGFPALSIIWIFLRLSSNPGTLYLSFWSVEGHVGQAFWVTSVSISCRNTDVIIDTPLDDLGVPHDGQ